MKTIHIFYALAFAFFMTSCNAQSSSDKPSADKSISKIEVMDFHSTHRCMTCNAIEANTKYTLETYVADELENDKLSLQIINVDEEANEAVAEKFEAFGTALILNVIKNGKETHINLTDFAFMKGNDQAEFSQELKAKITEQLQAL